MFIGIVVFVILVIMLMLGYITYSIHKCFFVSKIKNKKIKGLVTLLPLFIYLIYFLFDKINSTIVLLHITFFEAIFDLILFLIKKLFKKSAKYNLSMILTCVITLIYLGYGYFLAHNIVETRYTLESNKDIGRDNLRIVQISDSHIGATLNGNEFIQIMERINETNPDIVVITGDFVDDDTKLEDMVKACIGLGKLQTTYGVYYVYGNHDKGYMTYRSFNNNVLKSELIKNNVIVLEDDITQITNNIYLVGRKDKSDKERKSISKLIQDIDKSNYIIALDHQPTDFVNEAKANIDLVLCGHTHGGQFIFLGPIGVKLGINDGYYGMEKRDNTTYIINSGLGDWAIHFKTGCVSEYTVIDIKNKGEN